MDVGHHVVPALAPVGALAMTEPEMCAWGERLGRDANPPTIIALTGELGAGKTTLVQAICRGYGVTDPVTSPTYALVQEYVAPRSPVIHIDLYRLNSPAQLDQLGWDELVGARALILVEWPERAGDRFPAGHVPISLEYDARDAARRIVLAG